MRVWLVSGKFPIPEEDTAVLSEIKNVAFQFQKKGWEPDVSHSCCSATLTRETNPCGPKCGGTFFQPENIRFFRFWPLFLAKIGGIGLFFLFDGQVAFQFQKKIPNSDHKQLVLRSNSKRRENVFLTLATVLGCLPPVPPPGRKFPRDPGGPPPSPTHPPTVRNFHKFPSWFTIHNSWEFP